MVYVDISIVKIAFDVLHMGVEKLLVKSFHKKQSRNNCQMSTGIISSAIFVPM